MARKYDEIFIKFSIFILFILVCTIQFINTEQINKNNSTIIENQNITNTNNNVTTEPTDEINATDSNLTSLQEEIIDILEECTKNDHISLFDGTIVIEKINDTMISSNGSTSSKSLKSNEKRSTKSFQDIVTNIYDNYVNSHVVHMRANQMSRLFKFRTGNSFMTGFGLGFLAFGLKKLLLPVFIGAQIVKSVIIAMFLPSILGGLGKLVGKGLSSFSGASGSSNHGQPMEEFDFKDPANTDFPSDEPTETGDNTIQDYTAAADSSFGYPQQSMTKMQTAMAISGLQQAMNRYSAGGHKVQYLQQQNDNYYIHKPIRNTQQNFKVFHKIPSSSLLLTSYDPFYSPLLSRLDAIFKQMGIGHHSEKCRERMVCLMYANPAKYAPYSNLISAQLSRELNELRKPTTDNPDILRFFKYMKAAKDGQDGNPDCPQHIGCPELTIAKTSPAMLTTYNEINKLVLARNLK